LIRRKSVVFTAIVLGALALATGSGATTTSSGSWFGPKSTTTTVPVSTPAPKPAPAPPTAVNGTASGRATVGFGGSCAEGQVFSHGKGTWQGAQTGKGNYKLDLCADVTYGDTITARVLGTMRISSKAGTFKANVLGSAEIDLVNESATYDYTVKVISGRHAGSIFHLTGNGTATSLDFNKLVAHMADNFSYTGTIVR
jgi:hypothetical protein